MKFEGNVEGDGRKGSESEDSGTGRRRRGMVGADARGFKGRGDVPMTIARDKGSKEGQRVKMGRKQCRYGEERVKYAVSLESHEEQSPKPQPWSE